MLRWKTRGRKKMHASEVEGEVEVVMLGNEMAGEVGETGTLRRDMNPGDDA